MSDLARATFEAFANKMSAELQTDTERLQVDPLIFVLKTDTIHVECVFNPEGRWVRQTITRASDGSKVVTQW